MAIAVIKHDERVLDFLETRHTQVDNPVLCWIEAHASAHWPRLVLFEAVPASPHSPPGTQTVMRCCVCRAQRRIAKRREPE